MLIMLAFKIHMVVIIMCNGKIMVGDRVEVSPIEENSTARTYVSKVETSDNKTVQIHAPFQNWGCSKLPLKEAYWLRFISGLFRYKATLERYTSVDDFQLVEFQLIGECESLQKRDYFRLSTGIPIKYTYTEKDELGKWSALRSYDAMAINLSGGGIMMTTEVDLAIYDFVLISMPLDDDDMLLVGEIRTKDRFEHCGGKFRYGIKFRDISDIDRDKIIRYIFRQQNLRIRALR